MTTDLIRNLLGHYCELVDAADWKGLGAMFAHGRLADGDGKPLAEGAEEVAAFFEKSVKLYDGSPRTKHVVTNSVFETETVVRSSYLVLQQLDGGPIVPIITGTYLDTFDFDDEGMLYFAERRYVVDLAGDLTNHLLR